MRWEQNSETVRFVRLRCLLVVCGREFDENAKYDGTTSELHFADIHGTSDVSSKRLRVNIGDQEGKINENITAYSHPYVNAGN